MSYEVLARKWRPRSFPELIGQDHVRRALVNALDRDRLHHAYLFTGTRGVGKTTIARILAKSLNCESNGVSSSPCGECSACREIDGGRFVDLIEVDAASRTRVDETRELLENVPYAPTRGRYKVYLIDEVHMFSQHSFNALLKTLEEPPPHVKFLLATTDPQKVPVTILSRCLQFNLKLMPVPAITGHLEHILQAEGVEYEEAALGQIARGAAGSMRDALSLLDQAISFGEGTVRAQDVEGMLGTLSRERLFALVEAVVGYDAAALMAEVDALARQSADLEPVLAELLSLLHQVAVAQTVPDALDESVADADRVRALAERMEPADVQLYYQIATLGRRDLGWAPDARTGLEMTLLRMLAFRPDVSGRNDPGRSAEGGAAAPGAAARAAEAGAPSPAASSAASGASGGIEAAKQAARAGRKPDQGGAGTTATPSDAAEPGPATDSAGAADAAPRAEASAAESSEPPSVDATLDWEATVEALELRGLAAELAANTALLDAANGRIRLGLGPDHAHLGNDRYRQRLESRLGEYLGTPVRVDLVEGVPEGRETPAQAEARRSESRREEAREAIESDPVVQGFQERFGARVEADSVRPADPAGSNGND